MALNRAILPALLMPLILEASSLSWEVQGPPGFAAQATLSAEKGEIPTPVVLKITLTYPEGYQPNPDEMRSHLLSFNAIYPTFHLASEDSSEGRTFEYALEPLFPGTYPLTFFAIPFSSKDDKGKPVEIVSGIFEYTSTLPQTQLNLEDTAAPLLSFNNPLPLQLDGALRRSLTIASPEELAEQSAAIKARSFPWLGVLGILTAAAVYLAYRLKPKAKKVVHPRHMPSAIALERAIQLHQAIQKKGDTSTVQQYFYALTDAVRCHIEEKYHLPAVVKTTEEFLAEASQSESLEEEKATLLKEFLAASDRVKFGRYHPAQPEIDKALSIARQFIG